MLADVRLTISQTEARLLVKRDDAVVEDELWKFGRKISRDEAKDMAQALFSTAYDVVNFVAHGDGE